MLLSISCDIDKIVLTCMASTWPVGIEISVGRRVNQSVRILPKQIILRVVNLISIPVCLQPWPDASHSLDGLYHVKLNFSIRPTVCNQ